MKETYSKSDLQNLIKNKFGKEAYFQKFEDKDETIIIYGIWLTSEDAMDYAGTITLKELVKN